MGELPPATRNAETWLPQNANPMDWFTHRGSATLAQRKYNSLPKGVLKAGPHKRSVPWSGSLLEGEPPTFAERAAFSQKECWNLALMECQSHGVAPFWRKPWKLTLVERQFPQTSQGYKVSSLPCLAACHQGITGSLMLSKHP